MKMFVNLMLSMLSVFILGTCATAAQEPADEMLKPGDKVGSMTVEEHSMSTKFPDIYDYCTYQPEETQPGIQNTECNVPLMPRMQIDFGWSAEDAMMLDANWDAMAWELYIDGYQIDLAEFGQWSESGRPDLGMNRSVRGWILDLNNISLGKHTLRYLWRSETSIDDGFNVYAPGTYEHIFNFTVLEN